MMSIERADRDQIYRDFKEKVARYIRSHVSNPHDAEDLTSAVFMKVYEKLDTYDSSRASLSTWIYVITQRTVTDWLRKKRPTLELIDNLVADEDMEEQICQADALDALAAALTALPERQRDVVILHYYRGYALKEIAQRMGLSYTTIKTDHSAALAQLKRTLT